MALKTPLPPNSQLASISVVGNSTGETYKADFVITQILSHRQQLLNDRLFREYLGGENPSQASIDAKQRAQLLADINSSLQEPVPQFWREKGMGLDLLDDNVLMEVWAAVQKVFNEVAERIKEKTDKDADRLKKRVEKGPPTETKQDEE